MPGIGRGTLPYIACLKISTTKNINVRKSIILYSLVSEYDGELGYTVSTAMPRLLK